MTALNTTKNNALKNTTLLTAALAACLTGGIVSASHAQAPALLATGTQVVIPERTQVKMTLMDTLKSGSAHFNDEVDFQVAEDVYGPGHVLMIAAGTPGYGKVTQSRGHGMFGRGGKLEFTCDYILTPNGTRIALRSPSIGQDGRSNTGAAVGIAMLVSGLGIFIHGNDVQMDKGTQFAMMVDQNTAIVPPYVVGVSVGAPQVAGTTVTVYTGNTGNAAPSSAALSMTCVPSIALPASATLAMAPAAGPAYTPAETSAASASGVATFAGYAAPSAEPALSTPVIAPSAPAVPAPADGSGKMLFLTADGKQIVGKIAHFNGVTFTLTTDGGVKYVKATSIKATYSLR